MKSRTKRSLKKRKGAAVVEFAVCLPVIFIIVMGAIEAASMLFLRQALIQSAYEGIKVAIKNDVENADAVSAVRSVTDGRRLNSVTVSFQPSDITTAQPGELIRITVSSPGDANSFIPFGPFKNRTVAAEAVMVKE